MPAALPPALVDLLREMRAAGVSINGLIEATGINRHTVIKYTSALDEAVCGCGRPRGHPGNCTARRAGRTAPPGISLAIGDRTRKWTAEAERMLGVWWRQGLTPAEIAPRVNALLGRTDISPHAVQVKVGKLKLLRHGKRSDLIAQARRDYWARWRRGEVTDNERCPSPVKPEPVPVPPRPAFSMSAMRGGDPFREARRAQKIEAMRGRV
jgi:hypothetical protein